MSLSRKLLSSLAVFALAGVLAAILLNGNDWHASGFGRWAASLSVPLLFLLLSTLPQFGFPISLLYFLVGARLEFGPAMVFIACSLAVNLCSMYWIARNLLRNPVRSFIKRSRYRLPAVPAGEYVSLALLTALVPGPFGLKNYLLGMSGISFKTFFGVCWPIYVTRASLAILFGGMTGHMTLSRGLLLAGYAALIFVLSAVIVKRWQAKMARRSALIPSNPNPASSAGQGEDSQHPERTADWAEKPAQA